eukprot:10709050-Karenia_brevis.AAC.1
MERYAHLGPDDFEVIRWVVSRGSGCMWLPDSPRTTRASNIAFTREDRRLEGSYFDSIEQTHSGSRRLSRR